MQACGRGTDPMHSRFRLYNRCTSPLLLVSSLERQTRCARNEAECRVTGIAQQLRSVASVRAEYAPTGRVALGYLLQTLLPLA
jgi:hypothetical protein